MHTHTHTHTVVSMLDVAFFFFTASVKNRRGAFVLLKIHLIMSVAGSLPELVGFKRRKRKKKKTSLECPAQCYTLYTPNTVAQILHNTPVKQLLCLEPLEVDGECCFQGGTQRVEECSAGRENNAGDTIMAPVGCQVVWVHR